MERKKKTQSFVPFLLMFQHHGQRLYTTSKLQLVFFFSFFFYITEPHLFRCRVSPLKTCTSSGNVEGRKRQPRATCHIAFLICKYGMHLKLEKNKNIYMTIKKKSNSSSHYEQPTTVNYRFKSNQNAIVLRELCHTCPP